MPQSKGSGVKEKFSEDSTRFNFQCIDAIEASLCIEKEGLIYYESAAKEARDPQVKDIFIRLAEEEKDHIQSLQAKAKFLQPAIFNKSISRKRAGAFIARELKGKVFPPGQRLRGRSSESENDLQALEFGIESEKRSIRVLQKLLVEEKKLDVRVIFSHLLVEEKKHLEALESLKKSLISR